MAKLIGSTLCACEGWRGGGGEVEGELGNLISRLIAEFGT